MMGPSFIWNINMRKIFIAVALIVAYGSDKGISENSEYVSAYEDTTFKF